MQGRTIAKLATTISATTTLLESPNTEAGDLTLLFVFIALNIIIIGILVFVVSHARRKFPEVYSNNVTIGEAPRILDDDSLFGWLHASWDLDIDDVEHTRGLDQAMHLEFMHFSMRLLVLIGVPLVCVLGPLHWLCGGGRPGTDTLSKWGMANVADASDGPTEWIYWIHSALVWAVVVLTTNSINDAQEKFIRKRMRWLKEMPAPRCNTVLFEGIPDDCRTDDKMAAFLDDIFEESVVKEAHVVKRISSLSKLTEQWRVARLRAAADGTTERMKELEDIKTAAKLERSRLDEKLQRGDADVHSGKAFVTFKDGRFAEMAKMVPFTHASHEYQAYTPPSPADVNYLGLQMPPSLVRFYDTVGHACIAGLFFVCLPAVFALAFLGQVSNATSGLPGSLLWRAISVGFIGPIGLQIILSAIPVVLLMIFKSFFFLRSASWTQHRLQQWYFGFLMFLLLLANCIGANLADTIKRIAQEPFSTLWLLADTMPETSHFYFFFTLVWWVGHALNTMRFEFQAQFAAYLVLKPGDKAGAYEQSREDYAHNGLGGRSARFTIMLVVPLVFCIICPLITVLSVVNFMLGRLFIGYLVVFAERKKPDLGGAFWVAQLTDLHKGLFLFVLLMTGMLYQRAVTIVPGTVAGLSGLYLYIEFTRFPQIYRWRALTMEEVRYGFEEPETHLCSDRLPKVGETVYPLRAPIMLKDSSGNRDAWNVKDRRHPLTVVEVDGEGDFRLRNPAGDESGWTYAKLFVYVSVSSKKRMAQRMTYKQPELCDGMCETDDKESVAELERGFQSKGADAVPTPPSPTPPRSPPPSNPPPPESKSEPPLPESKPEASPQPPTENIVEVPSGGEAPAAGRPAGAADARAGKSTEAVDAEGEASAESGSSDSMPPVQS